MSQSGSLDGWWECSDGDVFPTRERALDHLRLVEVDGRPDRLRLLPGGEWERLPLPREDDDELAVLREALTAIRDLPYPQRNPDGDEQYVETVRLIASDALLLSRESERPT